MKPPRENISGLGNVAFEDPAFIFSEVTAANDDPLSSETIDDTRDISEVDFNLQGPSEIP